MKAKGTEPGSDKKTTQTVGSSSRNKKAGHARSGLRVTPTACSQAEFSTHLQGLAKGSSSQPSMSRRFHVQSPAQLDFFCPAY